MQELIQLRGETTKTFELDSGQRRLESYTGAIHYKDNYVDLTETWKDVDLIWVNNQILTAPYELTRDGGKFTFKDKKTGEVSTIERIAVFPAGILVEVIPFFEGVRFQHILPSDKVPFEAQFRVTGKAPITRAFDDEGELELETTFVDGILTEKLSQVKDRKTGQVRPAKGNILIDPTLTVQPAGKDAFLDQDAPTVNYGSDVDHIVADRLNMRYRAIAEFDISGLPAGATLDSATLSLYYASQAAWTDPSGKTVWAYKLTRTDWVELQATNNIYKTANNWTTAGGDFVTSSPAGGSTTFPASYGWMNWNVLAIVQDAYDTSNPAEFLNKFDTEALASGFSLARWHSSNYTTDTTLRPKLAIDYTIVRGWWSK